MLPIRDDENELPTRWHISPAWILDKQAIEKCGTDPNTLNFTRERLRSKVIVLRNKQTLEQEIISLEQRINQISKTIAQHNRGEHDHWTIRMTLVANKWMLRLDELYEQRNEDEQ